MKPLKISMLGSRGIPTNYSGIERALEETCPRLVQRGHQVTVYTQSDVAYDRDEFKGVTIKRVPAIKTKHLETLTRVIGSLGRELLEQNDIIHFHALGPSVFSCVPRIFANKTVVTVHGLDWQRKKWGALARRFLRMAEYASAKFPNTTIVVSQALKKYYDTKYNIKTVYIPNGVTIPSLRRPKLIKRYGLSEENYILFVSRLVPEKGCHYLIEAFKRLATDKKLVIAGSSSHTETYEEQLHALSNNHPNIVFTGFVSGELLEELFSNAYLYVLPSEIEGLSLSLLEAMSYRRCVVTSDILENTSVFQNLYGYSFHTGDVDDLFRMLTQLLQKPEQVRTTGDKARQHVSRHYNWDHITAQTEAVYYSLTAEVNNAPTS